MAMPVEELLMEVSKLTELQSIRVTVKESFRGAAIAGCTTLLGGLFLGPAGLAIGGAIGGCTAAVLANRKFRSITHIILYDLSPEQKLDLAAAIRRTIQGIPVQDAVSFATRIAQDPTVATTVAMAVISYLNSQPGMEIID